ncbi:hypothetical protein [Mycobacterium hubeiense]|uniref:hypothetical protein n=1 Tax=Mycobacterium hubeiense TaxID=1867256 RepID=UPI001E2A2E5C|nr:hypothetical protein [Mycobacterium sp. QGD 101]
MSSRVRVAISGCMVASGLFIAGLGGAMAFADPGHGRDGRGDSDRGHSASDRDSDGRRGGERERGAFSPRGRDGWQRTGEKPDESPTNTRPTKPTKPSEEPCPPESPPPEPEESAGGGGGSGGGSLADRPSGPDPVPEMQLPASLRAEEPSAPVEVPEPVIPDAVAALPPAAVAVPIVPLAPIVTLPVIIAPSLGTGGAGEPAPPAGPSQPAAPRPIDVEPPQRPNPLPANDGDIAALSESFRIGYPDYLRTAQISQLMAVALPGVAGILILTGAGGFVGYRQAKAGHTIRPGSARFMS